MSPPYPTATSITNFPASDNDTLYDFTGTGWNAFTYVDNGPGDPYTGWQDKDGNVTNYYLPPAKGYWYVRNTPGTANWTQVKPYTWP